MWHWRSSCGLIRTNMGESLPITMICGNETAASSRFQEKLNILSRFRQWHPLNLMAPGHGWHIRLQPPTASSQRPPHEDFCSAWRERERWTKGNPREFHTTLDGIYDRTQASALSPRVHTWMRRCFRLWGSQGRNSWLNYSEFGSSRRGSLQKQVLAADLNKWWC